MGRWPLGALPVELFLLVPPVPRRLLSHRFDPLLGMTSRTENRKCAVSSITRGLLSWVGRVLNKIWASHSDSKNGIDMNIH